MKNFRYYILAASAALSAAACTDYLDVETPSKFDSGFIYSNIEEAERGIAGLYAMLTSNATYGSRMFTAYKPNTDVEFTSVANDVISATGGDFPTYQATSNNADITTTWNEFYKLVNLANEAVEGIEASDLYKEASRVSPSPITQLLGEARCLRALAYLDMVRLWGDIPFRMRPARSGEDLYLYPTDRDVILDSLITDLIGAEPLMLYSTQIAFGTEKANRELCQALIARIALTRGGWTLRPDYENPLSKGFMSRNPDYPDYYRIAAKYAGKVIDEKKHALNLSFADIWREACNWSTPVGDDIIFDIPFLKSGNGEMGYGVGQRILGVEIEGTGGTQGSSEYGFAHPRVALHLLYCLSFDPKDLRRDETCSPVTYDYNLNQTSQFRNDGMWVAKWNKFKSKTTMGQSSGRGTGFNYPYMRYADVLLMYAEAQNELGELPKAKEALKEVRYRAFRSEDHAVMVDQYVSNLNSKEDFFMAIFKERAWELGGEYHRKYDLARWNLFSKAVYSTYWTIIKAGKKYLGMSVDADPALDPYYDIYLPTRIPNSVYSRSEPDPANPTRTIMTFAGYNEILSTAPPGYSNIYVAARWTTLDATAPYGYAVPAAINYAFRGFINYNNQNIVRPTDPLVYLAPIPATAISSHGGKLKNYYGLR